MSEDKNWERDLLIKIVEKVEATNQEVKSFKELFYLHKEDLDGVKSRQRKFEDAAMDRFRKQEAFSNKIMGVFAITPIVITLIAIYFNGV